MNSTAQLPAAEQVTAGVSAPQATEQGTAQATAQFAQQPNAQQPNAQPTAGSSDRERGFAIASFVLGIVSVVSGWTVIAPVIGLVLGVKALRRETSERTLALWGVWLNGVMLGLAALAVLVFVLIVSAGLIALPFVA
ncbi:DUF4190 domain-containing protein [Leucobacter sp. HY1910]